MKRILGIFIIILIFLCISTVNAEDINLTDNSTLDNLSSDLLVDDALNESSHNHTKVSDIISDSPIKLSVNAPGGTFNQLQSSINSNYGNTIVLTGDYYGTGTQITINGNIVIEGNGHILNASGKSRIIN